MYKLVSTLSGLFFLIGILISFILIYRVFSLIGRKLNNEVAVERRIKTLILLPIGILSFIIGVSFDSWIGKNRGKLVETIVVEDFIQTEYYTGIESDILFTEEGEYEILKVKDNKKFTGYIVIKNGSKIEKKAFISNGQIKNLEEYSNDVLIAKVPFSTDNKVNGTANYYNPTGTLILLASYKDDILDGPLKKFYDNGQLSLEENYKNGVLDGKYREYLENGKLSLDTNFIDGKEITNEELEKIAQLKKAKEDSLKTSLEFNNLQKRGEIYYLLGTEELANGMLIVKGTYDKPYDSTNLLIVQSTNLLIVLGKIVERKEITNEILFHIQSSRERLELDKPLVTLKESFVNGERDGDYEKVTKSGLNLLEEAYLEYLIATDKKRRNSISIYVEKEYINYKEGKKNGSYSKKVTIYDIDGKNISELPIVIANYKNDVLDGEKIIYSTLDYRRKIQIKEISNYSNGILQGEMKTYYDNGQLKESSNYLNNIFHGKYISYFESGQIHEIIEYENGEKIGIYKQYFSNGVLKQYKDYSTGEAIEKNINNEVIKHEFISPSKPKNASIKESNNFSEVVEYMVLDKTYFYNSPSSSTVRKAFLLKGDTFTISKHENGYGYTEYLNTKGWILLDSKVSKK